MAEIQFVSGPGRVALFCHRKSCSSGRKWQKALWALSDIQDSSLGNILEIVSFLFIEGLKASIPCIHRDIVEKSNQWNKPIPFKRGTTW